MNIGKQIKAFRLKKSVTQEAMAEHFGITAQASLFFILAR